MEWYEAAFDRLYPVVYSHRDAGEAERVVASFSEVFDGGGPVLDLACGAGRYLSALGARRLPIWGLDLSEFLLRRAVDEGHRGRVVRADMRRIPFVAGAFATVLSMFTSFGYFDDDADNLAVLREVTRVLRPGGWFVLDFVNAERARSGPLERTERQEDGYRIVEDRFLDGGGRTLAKHVLATADGGFRVEYEERLRLYDAGEIEDLLAAAGLGLHARYGDYERAPYQGAASERLIVLARATPAGGGGR